MDTTQVWRCRCGFSSPQSVTEDWNIAHCPQCGEVTGFGEFDTSEKMEIIDIKLLARVRRVIVAEHAGFIRRGYGKIENACIEPGCSCDFGVCGPFRNPPVRCTSFEERVLPLDPDLEAAYWGHLKGGSALRVRRCAKPGCRKEVAGIGPNARYCAFHAGQRRRETRREYARNRRAAKTPEESTFYPSRTQGNQASPKAQLLNKSQSMSSDPPSPENADKIGIPSDGASTNGRPEMADGHAADLTKSSAQMEDTRHGSRKSRK